MSDNEEPFDILHPLSSLEWDELPSLPMGVYSTQMVCLKGTVYVGGGYVAEDDDYDSDDSDMSTDDRFCDARLFSLRPGVDRSWTVIETPTSHYALVVHDSKLLLVGGMYSWQGITNKIFSMNNNGRFVEVLPPMIEKRQSHSAVSTGSSLIVVGGLGTSGPLKSVEILTNGHWVTAPCIPAKHCCDKMGSAFDGEHWALRGISEAYHVSVDSLISGTDQSPWDMLLEPPNHFSAAIAYFGGHLLSIGGSNRERKTFALSPGSQSWVPISKSDLPEDTEVSSSCALGLPSGELIAIGSNKDEIYCTRVIRAFVKVQLVDPDVQFSVSTLFGLNSYGINLIEELSKDKDHFHAASGVELLGDDRIRGLSLAAEDYIRMIFEIWERSKRPTYPATWEGLFTVLRKINLGHLVGKIAKCVTGSVPEEPLTLEIHTEEETEEVHILKMGVEADFQEEDSNPKNTELIKVLKKEVSQLKREKSQLEVQLRNLKGDHSWPAVPTQKMKPSTPWREIIHEAIGTETLPEHDYPYPTKHTLKYEKATSLPLKFKPCENRPEKATGTWSTSRPAQRTVETQTIITDESQVKKDIEHTQQDQLFDLPGVEVVGRTSLTVTNSVQSFHWAGYGFKLHIPQDSLPAGVDQCRLDIIASVAGQYQLPDNHEFFSAVCWVRPNPVCRFRNKLTVEMQHCAKSTKLYFVRADCSQGVPYTFKKLDGRGSFTEQSSYGTLEVDHFSGFAVSTEDGERLYNASFFNLSKDPWTMEIYFTITWDDEIHINATKEYFDEMGAKEKSSMEVEFKKDTISLDIPISGGSVKEWEILPIQAPSIRRRTVDSYKPGRSISTRCRKLTANLPPNFERKIPARYHLVTLQGASEPNQMHIEIDAFSPILKTETVNSPAVQSASAPSSLVPYSRENTLTAPLQYPVGPSQLSLEQSHTSLTLSPVTHPPPPHWAMQLQHRSLTGYSHSRVAGDLLYGMAGAVSGSTRAIEYPAVTLDQLVDHVGIDKEMLNKEFCDQYLTKVTPLLHSWLDYAHALGLSRQDVNNVGSDTQLRSDRMRAREVLHKWKTVNAFNATFSSLINACLSLGDADTAVKICLILKEDHPSEDLSRPALTGEKRRQEFKEVTEHTEEEQVPSQRPEVDVSEDTSSQQ